MIFRSVTEQWIDVYVGQALVAVIEAVGTRWLVRVAGRPATIKNSKTAALRAVRGALS